MNREKVISELTSKTNRSVEECNNIYEVLENHLIIGKNNKEKIKVDFMDKLKITEDEADKTYNISMEILMKYFFNK